MLTKASEKIDADIAFAHRLADAAADAALPLFRGTMDIANKKGEDGFDPVTIADKNAEAAMRDLVRFTHPGDGFIGEEFDDDPGTTGRQWVVDPIDGTRAYISGIPMWTTLIALMEDGRPTMGMISQPVLKERIVGTAGGTKFNGNPVRVRECDAMTSATLSATDPAMFTESELVAFDRVRAACPLTRFGCDAYAYAMTAHGLMDLNIESDMGLYDIMALVPVIEGAGGIVTDWSGNAPGSTMQLIAAGDARVHAAALPLLADAATDLPPKNMQ